MTATAEIGVQEVDGRAAGAQRRASLLAARCRMRQSWRLLKRLMPGMPQFRPPSEPEATGGRAPSGCCATVRPWPSRYVTGASDGKRTEIREGEIGEGEAVIIDTATATAG